MKNEASPGDTIFRWTGILFSVLLTFAIVFDSLELIVAKEYSLLEVATDPTVLCLVMLLALFTISALVPALKWIQPAMMLIVMPHITFVTNPSSMYGLGSFVIAVMLLERMKFFDAKKLRKAVALLLYLYICEAIPLIGQKNAPMLDSIMPLLFTTVFIVFLLLMQKAKFTVYLHEPKPVLSLSEAGLSRTEAAYVKELMNGVNFKQMAADADVKDSTIRNTMAHVYKKMDVPDRAALMAKLGKVDIVD